MAKDKRPALQFYIGDWKKDPELRACSLAARGLWFEMICLMYESPRRGYLIIKDKPPSVASLARIVGADVADVGPLLKELDEMGVYSIEDGVIYCRRMVRDAKRTEIYRTNGVKGGNPALVGDLVNQKSNPRVNQKSNPPLKPEVIPFVEDEEEECILSSGSNAVEPFEVFFHAYPENKRPDPGHARLHWYRKNLDQHAPAIMAALAKAKSNPGWADRFAPRIDRWLAGKPWLKATTPLDSIRDARESDALMVRQLPSDAVERIVEALKAKHAKFANWPKSQFVNTPPPEFVAMVKENHHAA
jgi:hypothetical protein